MTNEKKIKFKKNGYVRYIYEENERKNPSVM